MAYSQGPYEKFASLPSPAITKVVGSRKINMYGRYEYDLEGNPAGMNPTAQRIILVVGFAAGLPSGIIADRELDERRRRIETAIEPMVADGSIRNVVVIVEPRGPGGEVLEQIRFFNTSVAKDDSVTI